MKEIQELNLGFSDAQNYMQRENKEMLNSVFVKNSFLDDLLKSNIYYLIGEKGTGKTAYATYLNNCEYKEQKSVLKFINSTDYEKFYELKKSNKIDVSGYTDIWKTILLLLLAKSVKDNGKLVAAFNKSKINDLMDAIDEYYNKAFAPEIISALKIVDNSDIAAELISKHITLNGDHSKKVEFSEQRLQMNLFYIAKQFSDSLAALKINQNITLYIDGIDVRPNQISYNDYLGCIRGLANATWALNTELFANIKDSRGRFKIVLLLRPDIFNSLNLHNATNKLIDNAVYLDWRTTYEEYYSSFLYKMANKLLSYDQDNSYDNIWENYFNWNSITKGQSRKLDNAFIEFLKISLSRPRDIQHILKTLQELMKKKGKGNYKQFDYKTYLSDEFQNNYSEYFLGSLKDQLSFYYSEDDFKHFKKFFEFFDDAQFTIEQYNANYDKYIDYILDNAKEIPQFVEDKKVFLQLLYDSNVVAAIEDINNFIHFSYREKNPTNIAPEVPYGKGISYTFHYGLYKKTKLGRF